MTPEETREKQNKNLLIDKGARAREIGGRKGGIAKTDNKKYAQKLRQIRKRVKDGQLTTDDPAWLLERATNSRSMALDMINLFDDIKTDIEPKQRVALLNTYNQISKTIHGEKIHQTNVNVNVSIEEWEKRLFNENE